MTSAIPDILADLDWRGLYADCTDRVALQKRMAERPITLYCGFDPTADSLHVGNLVPLFALRRFQMPGHHPIALAGGATGSIGDPTGKSRRAPPAHARAARRQYRQHQAAARALSRLRRRPAIPRAWWTTTTGRRRCRVLDFLRDIGKHFSVNEMVAKECVRARMEDREAGISYTEFSYMLLQAFDFYHLRETSTASCRSAAAINGATSPPASTSPARSWARPSGASRFRSSPKPTARSSARPPAAPSGSIRRRRARIASISSSSTADDADVVQAAEDAHVPPARRRSRHSRRSTAANPGAARGAESARPRDDDARAWRRRPARVRQRRAEILFGGSLEGDFGSHVRGRRGRVAGERSSTRASFEGAGMSLIDLAGPRPVWPRRKAKPAATSPPAASI